MSNILNFQWEGWNVSVHFMHEVFLYIEDDLFGTITYDKSIEAIKYSNKYFGGNQIKRLRNPLVFDFFQDGEGFYHELEFQINYHDGGNFYYEDLCLKLYDRFTAIRLIKEFERLADLDYTDNFRVALKGDLAQEAVYKVCRSKGCCGFLDETIDIEGKT